MDEKWIFLYKFKNIYHSMLLLFISTIIMWNFYLIEHDFLFSIKTRHFREDTESLMFDIIKIRLKEKDERKSGKGNP